MSEILRNPNKDHLIDEVARRYYDTATETAEVLDGVMRTEIPLGYDGEDIYSLHDNTRFGEMMKNSLEAAWELADRAPNLSFEIQRRMWESGERQIMIDMITGNAPNTMVVVSDFPHELEGQPNDVAGYNVKRKPTMLRVISVAPNGDFKIQTRTLDMSDRTGLEEIYAHFGIKPEPGQLLGQRIQVDLPREDQERLADDLTLAYDNSLAETRGGQWHAGRPMKPGQPRINTYDFVREQDDLLRGYVDSEEYGSERVKYGFFRMMKERYEAALRPRAGDVLGRQFVPIHGDNFVQQAHMAAARGRDAGDTFSACGGTIKAADEDGILSDYERAGYGNKSDKDSTSYSFNKKMYCVVCQKPPGKDEGKKMCGPCGICRGCDSKLKTT